jgi:hypothetical protein
MRHKIIIGVRFGSEESRDGAMHLDQTNFILDRMEALQKSMEELMKNFGAMAAGVKMVTAEVQGFRQQLGDFGEDSDGVKRRLAEPEKRVMQSRVEILQANNGPLEMRRKHHILGIPQANNAPHQQWAAIDRSTTWSNGVRHRSFFTRWRCGGSTTYWGFCRAPSAPWFSSFLR